MTRIAVLQPSYMPWLGYFDQIALCDAFVFYDDVQYDKNGWRNRNRIRTQSKEGWSWLTVPVTVSGFPLIKDVAIDTRTPWQRKHRATLEAAYARAPHRHLLDEFFNDFFTGTYATISEASIASVRAGMAAFDIRTPLFKSSELDVRGDKNSRLRNICKHFGATQYLSGGAARAYLDIAAFEAEGISVEFQDYAHPVYAQVEEPFISHLSAIDAILCAGHAAKAFVSRRTPVKAS